VSGFTRFRMSYLTTQDTFASWESNVEGRDNPPGNPSVRLEMANENLKEILIKTSAIQALLSLQNPRSEEPEEQIAELMRKFTIQLHLSEDVVRCDYITSKSRDITNLLSESWVEGMPDPTATLPKTISCSDDVPYLRAAESALHEFPCQQKEGECIVQKVFGFRLRQYRDSTRCIVCQRAIVKNLRSFFILYEVPPNMVLNTVCYRHDQPGEYDSSYLYNNWGRTTSLGIVGAFPRQPRDIKEVFESFSHRINLTTPEGTPVTSIKKNGLTLRAHVFYENCAPRYFPEMYSDFERPHR